MIASDLSLMVDIPWGRDELIAARPMGQGGMDIILIGEAKRLLNVSIEAKAQEKWSAGPFIRQARSNIETVDDWALIVKKSHQDPIVLIDFYYASKLINLVEEAHDSIFTGKRITLGKWVDEARDIHGKRGEWFCVIHTPDETFYFMEYDFYLKLLSDLVNRRINKTSQLRS